MNEDLMPTDMLERVEHIEGEYGVTVIYTMDAQHRSHVNFRAVEIVALGLPDGPRLYQLGNDDAENPRAADRYIEGYVKFDGCSHVFFGRDDGYLHLCGVEAVNKLARVLPAIFERCGVLMKARGVDVLEDQFGTTQPV